MKWTALGMLALVAMVATCAADDVTVAIGQAQSAYAAEDYKETSTQLQTALVRVNEKLIELLIAKMPAAPPGWTAEDPEGLDSTAFGMGFFAGLMVDRTYYSPSGSSIEFTIAANSPMLATFRMFISNPMLASMGGQSGMTTTSVCGYDAIQQFEDESALHILAGNATLITIAGDTPADAADVTTLANGTDCQGIVAIVE
ncbi:MAG: hypothetical protein ABIG03_00250 [Candidatus Eisenbacteria bacterium]